MIVVDTNVLVHATLAGSQRGAADAALLRDGAWAAPRLWRNEMRSVLRQQMRVAGLSLPKAMAIFSDACRIVGQREHDVETAHVLELASGSGCTAYDCEFASVALKLGTRLVTEDRQLLRAFPELAVPLEVFAAGG